MRRFRILALLVVPAIVVAIVLGVSPASRYSVLGLVRGESFTESRPVCYWAYCLKDDDEETRKMAATHLGEMCENAQSADQQLGAVLNDPSEIVRLRASLALFKIGPRSGEVVAPLCAALKDQNLLVRVNAAMALGRMGPQALPAVPDLIAATDCEENHEYFQPIVVCVSQQTIRALGQIGPEAHAAVPTLAANLKDPLAAVRLAAAVALGRIGEGSRPALPQLKLCLKDDNSEVKIAAHRAIIMISPTETLE